MRAFPELLVDIRTSKTSGALSSAVSDQTYTVLTYLEVLPDYQEVVEQLLGSSQSQRSWLMGQKEAPSPATSAEEEGGIMNLYVGKSFELDLDHLVWTHSSFTADVIGTLLIHLNQRAAVMRKPVGQAFMLDNGTSFSL